MYCEQLNTYTQNRTKVNRILEFSQNKKSYFLSKSFHTAHQFEQMHKIVELGVFFRIVNVYDFRLLFNFIEKKVQMNVEGIRSLFRSFISSLVLLLMLVNILP